MRSTFKICVHYITLFISLGMLQPAFALAPKSDVLQPVRNFAIEHVNNMLSKYPDGRFIGTDKARDDELCSLHPEIAVLWFMVYLSGEFLENKDTTIENFRFQFELIYSNNYNKYNKLVGAKSYINDLKIHRAAKGEIFLLSDKLRVILPVKEGQVRFEELSEEWMDKIGLRDIPNSRRNVYDQQGEFKPIAGGAQIEGQNLDKSKLIAKQTIDTQI